METEFTEFTIHSERNLNGIQSSITFTVSAPDKEDAVRIAKILLPYWKLISVKKQNLGKNVS